jgi:hypothetical protein
VVQIHAWLEARGAAIEHAGSPCVSKCGVETWRERPGVPRWS